MSPYQGAYRCGRPTEQILLFAVDAIVNALDCREVVCAAFLNFRKAFDSLDHVVLLECLGTIGVLGTELLWFTDYLSWRVNVLRFAVGSPHGLLLKVVFLRARPEPIMLA